MHYKIFQYFCTMQKKRIAVFASGSGTNAERIIRYFRQSDIAEVAVLVCNRPGQVRLTVPEASVCRWNCSTAHRLIPPK